MRQAETKRTERVPSGVAPLVALIVATLALSLAAFSERSIAIQDSSLRLMTEAERILTRMRAPVERARVESHRLADRIASDGADAVDWNREAARIAAELGVATDRVGLVFHMPGGGRAMVSDSARTGDVKAGPALDMDRVGRNGRDVVIDAVMNGHGGVGLVAPVRAIVGARGEMGVLSALIHLDSPHALMSDPMTRAYVIDPASGEVLAESSPETRDRGHWRVSPASSLESVEIERRVEGGFGTVATGRGVAVGQPMVMAMATDAEAALAIMLATPVSNIVEVFWLSNWFAHLAIGGAFVILAAALIWSRARWIEAARRQRTSRALARRSITRITRLASEARDSRARVEAVNRALDVTRRRLIDAEGAVMLMDIVGDRTDDGVAAMETLVAASLQLDAECERAMADIAEMEGADHLGALADRLLIVRNLSGLSHRAARQVLRAARGARRVVEDHRVDAPRTFNLKPFIEDLLANMVGRIRGGGHALVINGPDTLVVRTHPGALARVIAALTRNALDHGLAARPGGTITIGMGVNADTVSLTIDDDGLGVGDASNGWMSGNWGREPWVAEPLGPMIAHQLVTTRLGGAITRHSAAGAGTRFTISFPRAIDEIGASRPLADGWSPAARFTPRNVGSVDGVPPSSLGPAKAA